MVIGRARASEEGEVTPGPQVIVAQATEMAVQQIRDQMQQGAMQPLQYTPIPADADPLTRREMEDARPTDLNVLMGFVAREEREGFNARLQSSGIQNSPDELWETFTTRYQECRETVEGGEQVEVTPDVAFGQSSVEVERMRAQARDEAVAALKQEELPEEVVPLLPELVAFAAQDDEGSRQEFDQRIQGIDIDPQQLWDRCIREFRVRLGGIQLEAGAGIIENAETTEEEVPGQELIVEAGRNYTRAAETIEDTDERRAYAREREGEIKDRTEQLPIEKQRRLIDYMRESGVFDPQMLMNWELQLNIQEAAEEQDTETPDIDIQSLTDPAGSATRTAAQERARDALDKLRKMQQQGMSEGEIRDTEYFAYLASIAGSTEGAMIELGKMSGTTGDAIASSMITQAMMRRLLRAGYMDLTPHKTSEDRIA
ncbi:hypothetical protein KKE92_03355 [Candidatus Micrarchaeota archaeon]|nr:hypothetical protein [Candidatus Micrarchaeota archaeon]